MNEVELVATFDTEQTAAGVTRSLNAWFHWILEGDPEDIPEVFEDFGVTTEDYALDRDSEIDWEEPPRASAHGNTVQVVIDSAETIDTLSELLESLGAYEVASGEPSDVIDDDV